MLRLIDTNVLLRLINRAEPAHEAVRKSLRALRAAGDGFVAAPQTIAEFWSVSTRPASARGGFGFSVAEAERYVRLIERICEVVPDSLNLYPVWKQLVVAHQVKGVQAHDARLVAWMRTQAISHILTFNAGDFDRYPGITALSPADF